MFGFIIWHSKAQIPNILLYLSKIHLKRMKKKDIVFDIINKLSKNEKRFFRLYANLYSSNKNKNYMVLFDVLDKLRTYDKAEIIKKTQPHFPSSKLPAIKRYLKEQLFQALHLFYRNEQAQIEKLDQLSIVEVLKTKKQWSEAQKILDTLEKKSLVKEDFSNLFDIYTQQIWLAEIVDNRNADTFTQINQKYELYLEKIDALKEFIQIKKIHNNIRILHYYPHPKHKEVLSSLENIYQQNFANQSKRKFKSVLGEYYFLHAEYMVREYVHSDYDRKANILKKMIQLIKSNPEIFPKKISTYIALVNLCQVYLQNKQKENFYTAMQELEELSTHNKEMPNNVLLYWKYLRYLEFYQTFPQESLDEKLIEKIKEVLNKKSLNWNISQKHAIQFAIGRCYFIRKQFDMAKASLDDIFISSKLSSKDYYYFSARLLYILCFLESKLFSLAQRELLSLRRKLERDNFNLELYIPILNSLNLILKDQINNKPIEPQLKHLQTFLNKEEYQIFHLRKISFLVYWINSKIEN